ncbi:MAG: AMIN domain-containing protein [Nitrosomonas sp.]|nr:AMIN domain-containing protein [Nitrosomonas sp.]
MFSITSVINKSRVSQPYQLLLAGLVLLYLSMLALTANASAQITFTRVWAGPEYTRVTLESNLPIKYTLSLQSSPDQVILDLENIGINPSLGSLPTKIDPKDPLIKKANIAYLSSNGVRLTLALKSKAVPRAFVLDPMGKFGYRLVLDIFPPDRAANASENTMIH